MSCVSAVADNQTDFEMQVCDVTQETLTDASNDAGNFTDLNELISQSDNELILNKNYKFNSSSDKDFDGFTISKDNYVVDGRGHSIDGSGQVRIFVFTGSNITLKNVNIINANGTNGPAASFASMAMVDNCSFINNSASGSGGAIYINNSVSGCKINAEFINNSANNGGAIALNNGTVENASFKNNHAESGGAIYFISNGTVINSNFTNNSAYDPYDSCGGAIYFATNGTVIGSEFVNNTAGYYGGAVYIWEDGTIKDSLFNTNEAQNGGSLYVHSAFEVDNCNFTNNHARTGGAIEFWKSGIVKNSNFNNNKARFSGGAIYSNDNIKVSECNFTGNSADENSGGAVYIFDFAEFNNCRFTDNSVSRYGGAIYFNNDGSVTDSRFVNNAAEKGGAILTDGNLTISNSKFMDNAATSGKNIVSVSENSTLTLIDVEPAQFKNLNVSSIAYGETARISSDVVDENNVALNNGTLSVIMGNETYSANVTNGTATVEIPNLNAGNYSADLKYLGNDRVLMSSVAFRVFKQNATISAKNKAYIINYGGKYSITLKDDDGNVIAGKKISFKLNGKNIGSSTTNSKGVATISLTAKILKAQKAGTKKLVIKFADSNYNAVSKTVKITINKEKTKIVAKNKVFKKAKKVKKYAVTLKNSKGKAIKKVLVTLKVKGKLYKAKTNSKGKATFNLKKLTKTGKHTAVVKFKGSALYKSSTKKVKITVKK